MLGGHILQWEVLDGSRLPSLENRTQGLSIHERTEDGQVKHQSAHLQTNKVLRPSWVLSLAPFLIFS